MSTRGGKRGDLERVRLPVNFQIRNEAPGSTPRFCTSKNEITGGVGVKATYRTCSVHAHEPKTQIVINTPGTTCQGRDFSGRKAQS